MAKKIEPTTPIQFTPQDFICFAEENRDNREFNKYRLRVRRKLGDLGHLLLPHLQHAGLPMMMRTSLHHPYTFNRYAVQSQWLYFSPAPESYQELREEILGPDFKEDLEHHYTHTLLLIGIERKGLFISLKIHQQAWWDSQNLQNKCSLAQERATLRQLLLPLRGFALRLHDWPNRHVCETISIEQLTQYFQYFKPGSHWFHVDLEIASDSLAPDSDFAGFAREKLLSLVPLYRFIMWRPDNNFLFKKDAQGKQVFLQQKR
jgi:hypothetical protein